MPYISPDNGYLTLFNMFDVASTDRLRQLVAEHRKIIDSAAYPGWVSSTLHTGLDRLCTANCVQWRSARELEARYAGERYRRETAPLFGELSQTRKILRTQAVFAQQARGLAPGQIEISPARDCYTLIMVFDTRPELHGDLIASLSEPYEWLTEVPGYLSHAVFRGVDGRTVINYAQWESKELHQEFHNVPEGDRPAHVQRAQARTRELRAAVRAGAYRVVHARSADQTALSYEGTGKEGQA
jgi:heme-degrading monooxygenase HmoA